MAWSPVNNEKSPKLKEIEELKKKNGILRSQLSASIDSRIIIEEELTRLRLSLTKLRRSSENLKDEKEASDRQWRSRLMKGDIVVKKLTDELRSKEKELEMIERECSALRLALEAANSSSLKEELTKAKEKISDMERVNLDLWRRLQTAMANSVHHKPMSPESSFSTHRKKDDDYNTSDEEADSHNRRSKQSIRERPITHKSDIGCQTSLLREDIQDLENGVNEANTGKAQLREQVCQNIVLEKELLQRNQEITLLKRHLTETSSVLARLSAEREQLNARLDDEHENGHFQYSTNASVSAGVQTTDNGARSDASAQTKSMVLLRLEDLSQLPSCSTQTMTEGQEDKRVIFGRPTAWAGSAAIPSPHAQRVLAHRSSPKLSGTNSFSASSTPIGTPGIYHRDETASPWHDKSDQYSASEHQSIDSFRVEQPATSTSVADEGSELSELEKTRFKAKKRSAQAKKWKTRARHLESVVEEMQKTLEASAATKEGVAGDNSLRPAEAASNQQWTLKKLERLLELALRTTRKNALFQKWRAEVAIILAERAFEEKGKLEADSHERLHKQQEKNEPKTSSVRSARQGQIATAETASEAAQMSPTMVSQLLQLTQQLMSQQLLQTLPWAHGMQQGSYAPIGQPQSYSSNGSTSLLSASPETASIARPSLQKSTAPPPPPPPPMTKRPPPPPPPPPTATNKSSDGPPFKRPANSTAKAPSENGRAGPTLDLKDELAAKLQQRRNASNDHAKKADVSQKGSEGSKGAEVGEEDGMRHGFDVSRMAIAEARSRLRKTPTPMK